MTTMQSSADLRWYIVHTYTGQEDMVKRNLDLRRVSLGMDDRITRVEVPAEDEIIRNKGERTAQRRKLFPGYILVQMVMDDEAWFLVRNTTGVTGFISAEEEGGDRPRPVPLDDREVDDILDRVASGEPRAIIGMNRGDTVRISEGPFADMLGRVDEVDEHRGQVTVLISVFGRETPVELDFMQVEKI